MRQEAQAVTPSLARTAGVALALSGAGFRAALFHAGSLWRLNELGWLPKLHEVTSVSGGSLTAAWLGHQWTHLDFKEGVARDFADKVVAPLQRLASDGLDGGDGLTGFFPGLRRGGRKLAARYDSHLFQNATLQSLPPEGYGPRFKIFATCLQTGACVLFSQAALEERRVGQVRNPDVPLAAVVAASGAVPPYLCPVSLELDADRWRPLRGADLRADDSLRTQLLLSDGVLQGELGLDPDAAGYQTLLVSDAGIPLEVLDDDASLRASEARTLKRVANLLTAQRRELGIQRLRDEYRRGDVAGAYWGLATRIADYHLVREGLPRELVYDSGRTERLVQLSSGFEGLEASAQAELINWGYAVTDAAMRRHVLPRGARPGSLPLSGAAL